MKKIPLSELKPGEKARIIEIPQHGISKRLGELGLTAGATVECVLCAPLGDPQAYRIRGAVIAIRKHDCAQIETEALE